MNVITLSAVRFTKDLELKRSSNNTAILNFSVADNMKVNGEDKTIYLQCSAFGKQAEYLALLLCKCNQKGVQRRRSGISYVRYIQRLH